MRKNKFMANGQCGTLKWERSTSLSVKAKVSTVVKISRSSNRIEALTYDFDNLFSVLTAGTFMDHNGNALKLQFIFMGKYLHNTYLYCALKIQCSVCNVLLTALKYYLYARKKT